MSSALPTLCSSLTENTILVQTRRPRIQSRSSYFYISLKYLWRSQEGIERNQNKLIRYGVAKYIETHFWMTLNSFILILLYLFVINITMVGGIKSQAFCFLCDITEIGFVSKTGCTQRNKNTFIFIC